MTDMIVSIMETILTSITIADVLRVIKSSENLSEQKYHVHFARSHHSLYRDCECTECAYKTSFDQMSEIFDIGVVSRDYVSGFALLRILRYFIDNNYELFEHDKKHATMDLDTKTNYFNIDFTIHRIISHMASMEDWDRGCWDFDVMYQSEYEFQSGRVLINKTVSDIDLWNIKRFELTERVMPFPSSS
jgi:hypothetical protein